MNILIIEDEFHAQKELKRLLDMCELPKVIYTYLDSVEESITWLRSNNSPDLIFMDIQLSDGLSFEIFEFVEVTSPIIFTTAFDEYAIQAFKVNSVDYLLKPIELEALQLSLKKLESINYSYHLTVDQKLSLKSLNPTYRNRFVSYIGDQIAFINLEDVAYFFAEEKTVFLKTHSNQTYILENTLEAIEEEIDPNIFFRVNRSHIVSIKSIKKISKYLNSRYKLILQPPNKNEAIVSRSRRNEFMKWIDR